MSIRILVADDQPLIRAGIAMMLRAEPDFEVLAEASDGQQALELARAHRPDLVLMDARMPNVDGITATRQITTDSADPDHLTKVLVLTTFNDDEVVYGALRAGASGFLLKHAAPKDLITAVHTIAGGGSWIDPAVAGKVIAALAALPTPGHGASHLLERLTAREREVLALLAQGLSSAEIKDRLVLSEATVKTHISRVLLKTGSRDRAQAVVLAYHSGLVTPPAVKDT
ncbi:response regulator [Kocuria sp. LHG3120]|uniref:response regulator n=1 Tax=Kocuria sp. LHG3120 TaxID=2804590 RepID=UPI003CE9B473